MAISGKVKEILDWLERGKLVIDIFIALAGAKIIKAMLATFTKIPAVWYAPIELGGAALVLMLAMYLTKRWAHGREKGQFLATASVAMTQSSEPFDLDEILRHLYKSDLQEEMEKRVSDAINRLPAKVRETKVQQLVASGLISYVYDDTWWTIFRSQLRLLNQLNRTPLRIEDVKRYYDNAVTESPMDYKSYPFDSWMAYLRSKVLILDLPGNTIGITQRGKDFLKFLVHFGHSSESRRL